MSKFDRLHAELRALEPSCEDARPQVVALRRLIAMPPLMECMRNNYECAGPLQSTLRRYVKSTADALGRTPLPAREPTELHARIRHVVTRVALHEHAAHSDVRRWGETCQALCYDAEALDLLCAFADGCDDRVQSMVAAVLDYVVSECNRQGAPVMPFVRA